MDDKWQPCNNNGSLIHTQTHTHIHIYNLMLNAQNNMIIHVIVFLVIIIFFLLFYFLYFLWRFKNKKFCSISMNFMFQLYEMILQVCENT